jgi:hypothetical protein
MAEPDLFERMLPDLEARGLTPHQIGRAREYWLSTPSNEPLPCPLCFLVGRQGKLVTMPNAYGVQRLKCGTCNEPIELS